MYKIICFLLLVCFIATPWNNLTANPLSVNTTGETIHMKPLSDTVQIYLKLIDSKTIVINIALGDTIGSIKAQVLKKESIPVARQRLIFAGKHLENDKKLSDYNIKAESIILLFLRKPEN